MDIDRSVGVLKQSFSRSAVPEKFSGYLVGKIPLSAYEVQILDEEGCGLDYSSYVS